MKFFDEPEIKLLQFCTEDVMSISDTTIDPDLEDAGEWM